MAIICYNMLHDECRYKVRGIWRCILKDITDLLTFFIRGFEFAVKKAISESDLDNEAQKERWWGPRTFRLPRR
jgi:hypothetical protein